MNEIIYNIDLASDEELSFPSFTSSASILSRKRQPLWMRAKDIVSILKEKGASTTTQTLFNMETRGEVHTRRLSPRNIQFDLNEILTKFNLL